MCVSRILRKLFVDYRNYTLLLYINTGINDKQKKNVCIK